MKYEILLANNLVEMNTTNNSDVKSGNNILISTLMANLMSYGYALSINAFNKLQLLNENELRVFWNNVKPALEEITGSNRNMEAFVVYKNFPEEVLNKSEAEYWFSQILMYIGFPNECFTTETKPRDPLFEKINLKVLTLSEDNSLENIFNNYIKNKSKWSDNQSAYANWLLKNISKKCINISDFGFKENGIKTISEALKNNINIIINDATDVLRLAATMSEQDTSLRKNIKFKNFSKQERKMLLNFLEETKNLKEDMALRKTLWKKFLSRLHPGDFKFEKVKIAYNELYNGKLKSFNSQIESFIFRIHDENKTQKVSLNIDGGSYTLEEFKEVISNSEKIDYKSYVINNSDKEIFNLLKQRPGDFLRRFHAIYNFMPKEAVLNFVKVIPQLKTIQLLKFKKYIETINERNTLIYPPKGNWSLANFVENKKIKIEDKDMKKLSSQISKEIKKRLKDKMPEGVCLEEKVKNVKLQTNDQELAEYGRGTVFDIPDNIKFLRSASYWAIESYGNIWYDNSWNFFAEDWKSVGSCSWADIKYPARNKTAAIFSGDPTNSKDMEGRACQMIDLYIEELIASGVRYAIWNILAYSRIPFNSASDVLATLQMGEEKNTGKLYEPSRAQMVFKLQGESLSKYIAYIDLIERKIVYMDANLNADVMSAGKNNNNLQEKMPAYIEYMNSLPSVYDLMEHARKGKTPIMYSDKDVKIEAEKAYIFKKENTDNDIKDVNLISLLD